ncbi:MAG: hypothetical protein HYZ36_04375 [Pedosphaera parvula]|nr:hypothetical protein [Pedosphaera parvula]
MQTTLDLPDPDKLKRAFRSVAGLTEADAQILGNDAFGILVKGKSLAAATTLQSALRGEGIETHVVAESDLSALPATKFLNRLECGPDALIIYDPLGRSFPVDWKHIMLIAAGSVRLTDFDRIRTERRVARYDGQGGVYTDTVVDYNTRETRNAHLLVEIVLSGAVARYSIKADASAPLLFRYLEERRTNDLPENFKLLVRDLCQFAPRAALNQGAYHLREEQGDIFAYPTKNAFFEEITWLLWWIKQAEAQT